MLVNTEDCNGTTAFHFAAQCGKFEILKLLLNCGSDVKMVNYMGCTVLHLAVVGDSIECVELILQHHPGLVNKKNRFGWAALHLAAQRGKCATLKLLLDSRGDVKIRDGDGWTARDLAWSNDCRNELKKWRNYIRK